MTRVLYVLAACLCLAITAAHVFPGGALVVDAVRASNDLSETVIWLSYFTWHDGTVALLIAALAFFYAGARSDGRTVAVFFTLMLAGFGLTGLATAIFGSATLWLTPAPYAFNVIAIIAAIAVLTDKDKPAT